MPRWFHVAILSAMVFAPRLIGCSDGASQSKTDPKANAAASQPAAPVVSPPPEPLMPTPPTVSQPAPAANQPSIRLSTGVALAQTGPNGTMMSFSVEYEYVQGEPASEGDFWVIERAHGGPAKQAVSLSKQDRRPLYILIDAWRPEDGPFHAHIEDRKGNRISDSIELR